MSKNDAPQFKLGQLFDESFTGLSPKDVKDNLESVCYGKEEGSYTKNLNEAELGVAKSRFADVGLKIADIEARKKDAMEDFKHELKEPTAEKKELIEMIKHKSVRKDGILWLVDDPETNMMYKFDKNAVCVDVRPMLASERQRTIRTMKKVQGE